MMSSFEQFNVLVAHSNDPMRAAITEMLHGFGFKWVLGASDVKTTLEMLALNRIDLFVTHYDKNKLDGLYLTEEMRAGKIKRVANLPIVLVASEDDDVLMQKAMQSGVNIVIATPIVSKDFYSAICALLREERSQVKSSRYAGPDRRQVENRPTHQQERRDDENDDENLEHF